MEWGAPGRRSREGAWIEIPVTGDQRIWSSVAPARERGLKCFDVKNLAIGTGRSREGAWIEILGLEVVDK